MTTVDKVYVPIHRLRFVTTALLFDVHDASINIIRRILQARVVEVIDLGHNRSVSALDEDAQAIAISSYQGGTASTSGTLSIFWREMHVPRLRIRWRWWRDRTSQDPRARKLRGHDE